MSKTVTLRTTVQMGIVVLLLTTVLALSQETTSSASNDPASAVLASADDAGTQEKSAPNPAADTSDGSIRRLGTPFPLEWRADGLKLGPLYMTDFALAGFYWGSSSPGQPPSSTWGSVMNPEFILNHKTKRGLVVVQASPYISVAGSDVYLNQNASADFTSQLTARLSLSLEMTISYLQNSYFQNPQYLLGYTGTGFVLQPITAQYRGPSFSAANNFYLKYHLSRRTQISLAPEIGSTFLNQLGQWSYVQQYGGGVLVSRSFNPETTGSISYNVVHSVNSLEGGSTTSSWTTQTFALGFQDRIGKSWWLSGTLGGSLQQQPWSSWTPTGSLTLMKSFRRSSVAAAYTRTRADQVLLSSGYFDQGDISYAATLSPKWQFNVGVGEYRTVETTTSSHGKRANGTLFYQLFPSCALFAQYNYIQQSGSNTTLFAGDNSFLSFGLRWKMKRRLSPQ